SLPVRNNVLKITVCDDPDIVEQSAKKYQPAGCKVHYKTFLRHLKANVKMKRMRQTKPVCNNNSFLTIKAGCIPDREM
ncbi:hypothetical protein PIA91_21190, partial [Klebsiella michiganensis]|uniref:hypothetical protein n=1 Tax=Klebsiella michiganensis TaxID=1134687 RepID=UPI00237B64E7